METLQGKACNAIPAYAVFVTGYGNLSNSAGSIDKYLALYYVMKSSRRNSVMTPVWAISTDNFDALLTLKTQLT